MARCWAGDAMLKLDPWPFAFIDKLFTHRWRLDQAEEAYRVFDTQTTGKGVNRITYAAGVGCQVRPLVAMPC